MMFQKEMSFQRMEAMGMYSKQSMKMAQQRK